MNHRWTHIATTSKDLLATVPADCSLQTKTKDELNGIGARKQRPEKWKIKYCNKKRDGKKCTEQKSLNTVVTDSILQSMQSANCIEECDVELYSTSCHSQS